MFVDVNEPQHISQNTSLVPQNDVSPCTVYPECNMQASSISLWRPGQLMNFSWLFWVDILTSVNSPQDTNEPIQNFFATASRCNSTTILCNSTILYNSSPSVKVSHRNMYSTPIAIWTLVRHAVSLEHAIPQNSMPTMIGRNIIYHHCLTVCKIIF
jgi:hypothetical protein